MHMASKMLTSGNIGVRKRVVVQTVIHLPIMREKGALERESTPHLWTKTEKAIPVQAASMGITENAVIAQLRWPKILLQGT